MAEHPVRAAKTLGLTILFAFAFAFALGGALAMGLVTCDRQENPQSSFATYAELEASGLIERGWIPTYLPRSLTEIGVDYWLNLQNRCGLYWILQYARDGLEKIQNFTSWTKRA